MGGGKDVMGGLFASVGAARLRVMSAEMGDRKPARHYDKPGQFHVFRFSCYRRMPNENVDRTGETCMHWCIV